MTGSSWAAVDLEPFLKGGEITTANTKYEFLAAMSAVPDPRCPLVDRSKGLRKQEGHPQDCNHCQRAHEVLKAICRMPGLRPVDSTLFTMTFACPFDTDPYGAVAADCCSFDFLPGGEEKRFWCCCGRSDAEHEEAILRWQPPPPRITCSQYGKPGHDAQACPVCIRARSQARAIAAEEEALADEWSGVTGDLFDPDTPEPVPCVLEIEPGRFVFAPGISFLFGRRGSVKTWLADKGIVQELRRGNRVALIDYEMSYKKAMRRLTLLGATKEERSRVIYFHPSASPTDRDRQRFLQRFAAGPPSLVVIDSLGMALATAGLEENSGSAVAEFSTALLSWLTAEWPDAVILVIDHVTKGSTGSADPIGSQRKGAIADHLYSVTLLSPISRQVRGSGRVVLTKDRDGWGEEGSAVLDFEFGGGGPFVVRPPDPEVVGIDGTEFGSDEAEMRRVAQYVGSHEGCMVEQTRGALSIHPTAFNRIKKALVAKSVVVHHKRTGLFKGTGWEEYCVPKEGEDD